MRSIAFAKYIFFLIVFILCISAFSCSKPPEGTVVTISLPKKTYKMYEPILLEYEWINYKDKPDSIWAIFSQPPHIKQFITDERGNLYKQQLTTDALIMYFLNQVLNKNDTLRKSIYLNLYGRKFGGRGDSTIFYSDAYFPPGNYTIYSVIDEDVHGRKFSPPITTNKIEFEIEDLDNEDASIIEMVRSLRFNDALIAYPESYFAEHLKYWNLWNDITRFIIAGVDNGSYKDTTKLGDKYRSFFNDYPNSLYYFQNNFLMPYLQAMSNDSIGANNEINLLISRYPNTMISTELKQFMQTEKLFGRSLIWMK